MSCKFAAIVGGNSLQSVAFKRKQKPADRFGQRLRFFPFRKPFSDDVVRTSFCERKYGIAVAVGDDVHLPIAEPLAVSLHGSFVYANPILYVRSLCLSFRQWRLLAIFQPMATMLGEFASLVSMNVVIYCCVLNGHSFFI